eukprot:TRINITY_DN2828_c0_g1_i1.p1 TRINITY_DN2828_c0_g1~~TRINITY_DN2828_c0_g1_i1.p1  ORF type:complete len:238 (-),score=73.27 TRINITY_DN2828_c0_g1_i1:148-861(-)
MYNGIGLTTPRGSGTSGYTQKNLAFVKPKAKAVDYEKQFKEMMENPVVQPRKANQEIVKHERLHRIEAHLFEVRLELEEQGLSEDQIQDKLKEARVYIEKKLEENEGELSKKESHTAALAKERQTEKFREALRISKSYKPGSAFDFETQQKEEQEKQAKRDEERRQKKANAKKVIEESTREVNKEEKNVPEESEKKERKHKKHHKKRSRSRSRERKHRSREGRRRHDSSSESNPSNK